MKFYVNSELMDITLEGEKTVGEILGSFETVCSQNKCATIGIEVNGNTIDADKFDEIAAMELKDDTEIKLTIVSEQSIAEMFKRSSKEASDIAEILIQVPVMLQSGKDSDAFKAITHLTDIISNFCHAITLSSLFPDKFNQIKIEDQSLSDFFNDFSKVFNDFNDALQNNDTVLIGDISEYEICPRLKALSKATKDL